MCPNMDNCDTLRIDILPNQIIGYSLYSVNQLVIQNYKMIIICVVCREYLSDIFYRFIDKQVKLTSTSTYIPENPIK